MRLICDLLEQIPRSTLQGTLKRNSVMPHMKYLRSPLVEADYAKCSDIFCRDLTSRGWRCKKARGRLSMLRPQVRHGRILPVRNDYSDFIEASLVLHDVCFRIALGFGHGVHQRCCASCNVHCGVGKRRPHSITAAVPIRRPSTRIRLRFFYSSVVSCVDPRATAVLVSLYKAGGLQRLG